MTTPSAPPQPHGSAHTVRSTTQVEEALAHDQNTAQTDGERAANTHAPDSGDGFAHAWADGVRGTVATHVAHLRETQRMERIAVQAALRDLAGRLLELAGCSGLQHPTWVAVTFPLICWLLLFFGAMIVVAEAVVLYAPLVEILQGGTTFSWIAALVAVVVVTIAGVAGHGRALLVHQVAELPAGPSRRRSDLVSKVNSLTAALLLASLLAFAARTFSANEGHSWFTGQTFALLIFQLIFFAGSIELPDQFVRHHREAVAAGRTSAKVDLEAQQQTLGEELEAVDETHTAQVVQLEASRPSVTTTFLLNLAAHHPSPAMGAGMRRLLPLVRADGSIGPHTETPANQDPRQEDFLSDDVIDLRDPEDMPGGPSRDARPDEEPAAPETRDDPEDLIGILGF